MVLSPLASSSQSSLFAVAAVAVVAWCNKVLCSNLTYFRLRRVLFDEFVELLGYEGESAVSFHHETLMVIRQFLTERNDALNDNKRLSFDKTVFELLAAAQKVLSARGAAAPAGPIE